ncbi:hypothetical protein [Stackebrandtia nassauensis]|uniref:Uncharacterized protein n=1 Tax=Stackebrandtia nassauensis (strain DSM 44728 / CIP 108903 / NRRL B-16338 / NBRC 102104 / LLR-40K-21) TaxID=446470 RepID=D3Q5T9_STANL|nr:hypothetical protein [Stackebrandtia nassauensis]ADD40238.1 hypothetical protein Snas_0523 [Stackebrandtia nassauensis DSM 44728]
MTINSTPTVPPQAASIEAVPAGNAHPGASPRPKRYHGRHRRPRNAG